MNDRIRQLIVECTQPSIDGFGNWTDTEKLVNLVVKDCVDTMEKCFAGGEASMAQKDAWGPLVSTFTAWNAGIKCARQNIETNYGIKK